MTRKSLELLCKKAAKLGAKDSKVVKVSTVETGAWVRNKCQYGCPGFGERLTCPPYTPTPEQTRAVLSSYKKAILIHCKSGSLHDISDIVFIIEKAAFLAGFYKAFGMGAGPCRLCARCNVKAGCRRSYKARPSMEACGIDVYQTARRNGFKIEVVESPRCKADYFGLVLIE
jgi:predicted metal-binding protein